MNKLTPSVRTLDHVTDWIFDLDNTLYPRECNLFAQIDTLITHYVMDVTSLDFEAARDLQKAYYRDHGTTLNGLMTTHDVDPDHYLAAVHAIDYSPVNAHPELVAAIAALPGRKFIFTNADAGHAVSVLKRLGAADIFEGIFDIRLAQFEPKPLPAAYERFLAAHGVDPARAVMFDDLEKNLRVPHENGMVTVQVVAAEDFIHDQCDPWELGRGDGQPHVHHITDDLVAFLKQHG
ncbi:pyrimidine 5'-nucleotidase [Pelagibacterium xiamenense]|uniref:pyrimidine 5'-nucleotidase n=1 Tax=Pelagibacterium xiamenense TaxID=2901140 RepID=UPI001E4038F7|nr:pyrimidine 5'-nucleotidase [Pelagibacterium xiamenense]MCD7058896.1 pyrimidine 5'-nucleotidase [Pelagibacterium xiamenense]